MTAIGGAGAPQPNPAPELVTLGVDPGSYGLWQVATYNQVVLRDRPVVRFTASLQTVSEAMAAVDKMVKAQAKAAVNAAAACRLYSRWTRLLLWEWEESPDTWWRTTWRADAAEWLTLYLVRKGPVSTRRIKDAYRLKWSLNDVRFPELRAFAGELGFLDGTTWRLPADHPLAS